MADVLVLIHVLSGFWLVTGLLGRGLVQVRSRRAADIGVLVALMDLSGAFERLMVIPGSFAVFSAGLLTAWATHQPLAGEGSWWLLTAIVLFLSLVPVVVLVFVPRGKVFERVLADARSAGSVTRELAATLRDPVVTTAHLYELAVIGVIVALMVLKPF